MSHSTLAKCTRKDSKLLPKDKKLEKPDEFFHLLNVDLFVDSLLQFLNEKKCSETLDFVLQVEQIKQAYLHLEKLDKVKLKVQNLFAMYIEQGSCHELNLSNCERTKLLEQFSVLTSLDQTNEKKVKSAVKKLVKELDNQKQILLLQIKEERFCEFKLSSHWQQFLEKLNTPSSDLVAESNLDLSFRWITPVKQWSSAQVAQWLQSMGIEEYAQFEEHEINGRLLHSITREDINQMGITKIGSIKRILKLITEIILYV